MTTIPLPDIRNVVLAHGAHPNAEAGMCLLEAVSWIAGEKFGDHPKCVDVALAAYGRSLNDRLRDDERQLLVPLVPDLVGTAGGWKLAQRRAYHLVDRQLRSIVPAFLRELPHKPRPDLAERFERLSPVIDGESAGRARDLARECRDEVWAGLSDRAKRGYKSASAYAASASAYAAADAYASAAAAAAAAAASAYAAAHAYADAAYADYADAAYAAAAAAAAAAASAYAAAHAYADAAYADYADADAAYAAADDDADADADAAAYKPLRRATVERCVASFREAIEITEAV